MRSLLLALAATALIGAPVFAAETCEQSLKDTKAAFAANTIAPKETAKADELIKQAEALCKDGKPDDANDLLRLARTMIGE